MNRAIRTSLLALGFALAARGASAYVVTVDFNEAAFPTSTTNVTGTTQSFNVFNDATGAKFASLPAPAGDAADFSVVFSSQTGTRASPNPPTVEYQTTSSGRFTSSRGYSNSPSITSNNPGTVESTTMTLLFGNQLRVTNLIASFLSLNTAGTTFEYSVISLLRPDLSYFSAPPVVGAYSSFAGMTGMAGVGNYVAAGKGTVTGVGTLLTAAGADGPSDNLTLTYALVGLAAGTQIGGIQITNYLQDVRGTSNGASSFTASFTDFTVTASPLAVPEPSSLMLGGIALLGLFGVRRRTETV